MILLHMYGFSGVILGKFLFSPFPERSENTDSLRKIYRYRNILYSLCKRYQTVSTHERYLLSYYFGGIRISRAATENYKREIASYG